MCGTADVDSQRMRLLLLGIIPLFAADSVRVDVIQNEVWITRNTESSAGVIF